MSVSPVRLTSFAYVGAWVVFEAFVRCLACENAVWAMVVVVVLPFLEFGVEQASVVDAVAAFDFAVQAGCAGFDVDVVDAFVYDVPVKTALEF
jgi:hypothetical protein